MKNTLIFIVAMTIAGVSGFALQRYLATDTASMPTQPTESPVVGMLRPEFAMMDIEGKVRNISDWDGKVVLVNFWATWCPPCIEEMPSMERLNEVLAGDKFVMLAINTEENGRSIIPAFLERTPYTFPILYDNEGVVQKSYGVFKFPESFIVNKDGTVAEKIIGPLDWSSIKTITYFKNLIKG